LRIRLMRAAAPKKNDEPERRRPPESPAFFLWRRGEDLALLVALDTNDAALQWTIVADAPEANEAFPTVLAAPQWDLDACFGEIMAGEPLVEGRDEASGDFALWAVEEPDDISLLRVMSEPLTHLGVAAQPPSADRWPCAIFFTTNQTPANRPSLPPGLLALTE